MSGVRAARRYAKGLMLFANETNQAEQINREMIGLRESIKESRELAAFLASPVLDSKRKNAIGAELFKDFSPVVQNFIKLVVNQGRERYLRDISSQFTLLYNAQNRISIMEITSAVKLEDEMVKEIIEAAKSKINTTDSFEIESKIDPEILGGFILRVGDKQIDSSVRSKLNRLKKEFDKNEYIPKI